MRVRRYGKFSFSDLYPAWIGCAVMIVFGMMIIILHDNISESVFPYFLSAFMIIFSLIWLLMVLNRYNEYFEFDANVINVIKHRKIYDRIIIPQNPVFIISYADMTTKDEIKAYALENKYSVSIINTIPLNEALEILHCNHVKRYTNSAIKNNFKNRVVYSFVCERTPLDQLLQLKYNYIIIPQSIVTKKLPFKIEAEVYIDKGY